MENAHHDPASIPDDAIGLARALVGTDADAGMLDDLAREVDQLIETDAIILCQVPQEVRAEQATCLSEIPSSADPDTTWSHLEAVAALTSHARRGLFLAGLRRSALARLDLVPRYAADIAGGKFVLREPALVASTELDLCQNIADAGLPDGPIVFHGRGDQPVLQISSVYRASRISGFAEQ